MKDSSKNDFAIAIHGKVLRGAWTDENDQVKLFSAMLHDEAVTVAQVRVPDGTNEITQAEAILNATEIPDGKTVLLTMDAAHAQDETARIIGENPRADYAVTVKGNQPSVQREAFRKILPLLSGTPHDIMADDRRGRIKKWSCWITDAAGISFPHASQCAFIRREIFEKSGDRISKEHALVITSRNAGKMTAHAMNRHVRHHWGIENKIHYVRDTAYQEDNSHAWQGEGPQALASLRNELLGRDLRRQVEDGVKRVTGMSGIPVSLCESRDVEPLVQHEIKIATGEDQRRHGLDLRNRHRPL